MSSVSLSARLISVVIIKHTDWTLHIENIRSNSANIFIRRQSYWHNLEFFSQDIFLEYSFVYW